MKEADPFIEAYQVFRNSVDFKSEGRLPVAEDLVLCLLAGIPGVPADKDDSEKGTMVAVEQRVAILKAVFVETNREESDEFLDQGLMVYDEAALLAKKLLRDARSDS
ncbi:MAG: hypothetical protein C4582_09655 [Desulfobacteraceae bacterium]|jgi:hypothetical protein|nr:MAG: hypothetical protein C4582_09655 [Desulfobacteraceae bacterium]